MYIISCTADNGCTNKKYNFNLANVVQAFNRRALMTTIMIMLIIIIIIIIKGKAIPLQNWTGP
jgi:hypothetical protein